ncbi:hypothetical protein E3P88_03446 [Wallemia ichthyophaga]|uniref:F-box domain-containing protein n=1 Tax=Wallemia ichthyophaga TaxID=245174 RepID=A0A4T0H1Z0_WALIC|nr:hypothetical protein E3P93_03454 [Wallemia ichthyophaga]TIB09019.1 hypothetical protein E3P90_03431 [Wallemia ichthyophaga]TIB21487.1 hypothetical protein E3P88_03446 [Wallemia ichthyophaga]
MNSFEKLSDEIVLHIFENIDWKHNVQLRGTCRRFRRLSDDPILWNKHYSRTAQLIMTPRSSHSDYHKLYRISRNWSTGRATSSSINTNSDKILTQLHENYVFSTLRNSGTLFVHSFSPVDAEQDLSDKSILAEFKLKPIADISIDSNLSYHSDGVIRVAICFTDKSFSIFSFKTQTNQLESHLYQKKPRVDAGFEKVLYTSLNSPYYITCTDRFRLTIYHVAIQPTFIQSYTSSIAYHPASIHIDQDSWNVVVAYITPSFPIAVQTFPLRSGDCLYTNANKDIKSARRTSRILDISISRNSRWIALAREDNVVEVFELTECLKEHSKLPTTPKYLSLRLHMTLNGHNCAASSVAIANDRCVTGDVRGDIKIWNLKPNTNVEDISKPFDLAESRGITLREHPPMPSMGVKQIAFDNTSVLSVTRDFMRVYKFDV